MATTVLLSDYLHNKHFHLVFTDDEFVTINSNWNAEDQLLVDLSDTSIFKGKTMWSELQPIHYEVLITKNLSKFDMLNEDEQMDETNSVVNSLHFLITGLIKCLNINTNSSIELLRIDRITDDNINFIHHGSSCLQLELPKKKLNGNGNNGIKIIVDNTKANE